MIKQDFYTISEIADALRVSKRQVLNYCKHGGLAYYQASPGCKITISHDDYVKWLLSNRRISE